MARQDQYLITATVDNRQLGVFDSFKGGETDSEETKYRAGAMGDELVLGGASKVNNVTIARLNVRNRDVELLKWLRSRCGWAEASVTKQPLDVNGNAFGKPDVYVGILKSVVGGDTDSNSSDADVYELEISTGGKIG